MKKTAKKKGRGSWFSRYFGQSSRPSSEDLNPPMKDGLTVRNIGKTNSLVLFSLLFFSPDEGRLDCTKYRENQPPRPFFFAAFFIMVYTKT